MSNEELTVLEEIDKSMAVADGKIGFAIDESTHKPFVIGLDEAREVNRSVLEKLSEYNYDGSESERKNNQKFLAAVRKYKKHVKDTARDFENELLEGFRAEVGAFSGDIDAIIALADSRKKESDRAFREARESHLREAFDGAAVIIPELEGLSADDFFDQSMFNRSTTEKKAVEDLNAHIDAFEKAVGMNLFPTWKPIELASALDKNSWDAMETIADYQEDMRFREEAEMLRIQREAEEEARRARLSSRTIIKLSIKNDQVDEAKRVLTEAGIDFEVI